MQRSTCTACGCTDVPTGGCAANPCLCHGPSAPQAAPKPRFTRAERGFAKRAANRMLTQERREFPSDSNPRVVYTTRVMLDGKVTCDCRGWTIKKRHQPRHCRHTRELIGDRQTRTDGEFLYVAAYGGVLATPESEA
jgi:hypothetical protein